MTDTLTPVLESEKVRQELPHGLAVDFDKMFHELTGRRAAKANRKRLALLNRAAPVLRSALEPEEKVLYIAQGMVNNFWEQYFTGWAAIYRNQTLLIATDRRFILLHCDRKGRPCHFANEVPYQAITKLKGGGTLSSLTIGWNKGSLALAYIQKQDSKRFHEYWTEALTWHVQSPIARNLEQRNHLCPSCYTPIEQLIEACPRCRKYFKTPKAAALRSLALPGLGDLYLGHSFFAVLEMIGAAVVLGIVLTMILTSTTAEEYVGSAIVSVFLVAFYHGVDALVTLSIAKKGLIADDRKLAQRE